MQTLVIGGTGTVGSQVVRELLQRGSDVRVLVRSASKMGGLPAGAEGVLGDLQKPETLPAAMAGIEGVFVATAVAPDEINQGLAAVEAAKAAGVRRIVYMSVQDVEKGAHIPHFATKIPIEHAVKTSGLAWNILRPNNFFQNDLTYRDVIKQYGVYPQPLSSKGVSRVDVRDIALAAAICLSTPAVSGRTYVVAGVKALTGEQSADVYSRVLGRTVRYTGADVGAWASEAAKALPAWLVLDLKIMFEHFAEQGLAATDADVAELTKLLGRAPRTFEAFVREEF